MNEFSKLEISNQIIDLDMASIEELNEYLDKISEKKESVKSQLDDILKKYI